MKTIRLPSLKRKQFWRRLLLISILSAIAATWGINYWVTASTRSQLYDDILLVPHRKVGLLLGTSRSGPGGQPNLYYRYRIEAAVALFRAGRVDYLLLSGDNGTEHYDEPTAMRADLIAAGIPESRIILDYAGFRTLDSILRCKAVFGEDNIIVISQRFHNERAVFIANHKSVRAIAFNARDVAAGAGFRTQLREKLARIKMLLDLLLNTGPRFYGPGVKIG